MAPFKQAVRHLYSKTLKLLRILQSGSLARGLLHGVAAGVEHLPVLECISYRTVVDIGANTGQFSLAALAVRPGARVYAFEPLSDAAARYDRLFRGNPLVRCYRMAAGEERGEKKIYRARSDDSSSLLETAEGRKHFFPGMEQIGVLTVSVKPLTDILSPADLVAPALLKIDVQGYELEVLKGAAPLLSGFEWIYAECSFIELYAKQPLADAIIAWLNQNGFRLAGVFNQTIRPGIAGVQADLLFRRKE